MATGSSRVISALVGRPAVVSKVVVASPEPGRISMAMPGRRFPAAPGGAFVGWMFALLWMVAMRALPLRSMRWSVESHVVVILPTRGQS